MQRKALQVQVELDIQAVTCPGVCLCPNGKVSLQLYMLDSCIQTICVPPAFPIICNEKFIFFKVFYEAQRLIDLQKLLNKECLYIELIQWQNSDIGNVLATFQTNLSELLYPSTVENSSPGVDIDLLMEPERSFPGVIAPKIEVCTKTIIEDAVLDSSNTSVVNPKVIQSKFSQNRNNSVHLKRVCHSTGYHRYKRSLPKVRNQKPPFIVRKVDDSLLSRKPTGLIPTHQNKCNCFTTKLRSNGHYDGSQFERLPKIKQIVVNKSRNVKSCHCKTSHDEYCSVCMRYRQYFEDNGDEQYVLSPTNTKSCVLQKDSSPQRHRNCTCEEMNTTRTSKVIRCTSGKEKQTVTSCSCKPHISSLAAKLHKRLNQTLECIDGSELLIEAQSPYSPPGSDIECNCPNPCYTGHYKDCYKKIKSRINYDRYITPCCI